jgi:hypothetical protein
MLLPHLCDLIPIRGVALCRLDAYMHIHDKRLAHGVAQFKSLNSKAPGALGLVGASLRALR